MKIGIDLGGSHISVGVIQTEGKIISKVQENISFVEQEPNKIKELIRDKILSLINHVTKNLQIPVFIIEEIGIAVPGIIKNNIIIKCEKYGIYNWDLADELQKYYGIEVKLVNDAYAAAKAEMVYGNLKNVNKGVFLCIGTGIGGATILKDNEIFQSEYGHMIIKKDGRECHCTQKGCFETYASMKAFKDGLTNVLNIDKKTSSEQILEILNKQIYNEEVDIYIDEYINYLALGIFNIVNIIGPEKICIGGSFTYFSSILYNKLRFKLKQYNCEFDLPEIVLAKFENDAGIIGASI